MPGGAEQPRVAHRAQVLVDRARASPPAGPPARWRRRGSRAPAAVGHAPRRRDRRARAGPPAGRSPTGCRRRGRRTGSAAASAAEIGIVAERVNREGDEGEPLPGGRATEPGRRGDLHRARRRRRAGSAGGDRRTSPPARPGPWRGPGTRCRPRAPRASGTTTARSTRSSTPRAPPVIRLSTRSVRPVSTAGRVPGSGCTSARSSRTTSSGVRASAASSSSNRASGDQGRGVRKSGVHRTLVGQRQQHLGVEAGPRVRRCAAARAAAAGSDPGRARCAARERARSSGRGRTAPPRGRDRSARTRSARP